MKKNHTGMITDNILLSLARSIIRKEERENREINSIEARGLALTIQGQYKFVAEEESNAFADDVVSSFEYIKSRQISYINKLAYASFKADEYRGKSILDEQLKEELTSYGYVLAR